MTPCPNCGQPNEPEALECASCSVIFSKLKAKEEAKLQGPAPEVFERAPSSGSGMGLFGYAAVLGSIGALVYFGYPYYVSKIKSVETSAPAPAAGSPNAAPAAESPQASVPEAAQDPYAWLDPIVAEMNDYAKYYGVSFQRNDLLQPADQGERYIVPNMAAFYAKDLGLQPPVYEKMTPEEDKAHKPAKCGGELLDALPEDGSRYDCKQAVFAANRSGNYIIVDARDNYWLPVQWRPQLKSWGAYSAGDEIRGWEYGVNKDFGAEAQRKTKEESEAQLAKYRQQNPKDHFVYIQPILEIYRVRVKYESARRKIERLRMGAS